MYVLWKRDIIAVALPDVVVMHNAMMQCGPRAQKGARDGRTLSKKTNKVIVRAWA